MMRSARIIDFGIGMPESHAALFEAPFAHVEKLVKPARDRTKYAPSSAYPFWQLWNPRHEMRARIDRLPRFIATSRVSKHRVFKFLMGGTLPGSIHGDGDEGGRPTYNPTTCFETFPLPWPPGKEDVDHPAYKRIAAAAKALNDQRERWLNPPEWIEPIARKIDAADDFADVPEGARPLIRQSAIMTAAAKDARLKKRTLTNLYNERPTWLKLAHEQLDRAVLAAYAATDPAGDWSEDWAAVWTDTGTGQPLPEGHALSVQRAETDQKVLANLLRLNHALAAKAT
jgi:hypothetical protein